VVQLNVEVMNAVLN